MTPPTTSSRQPVFATTQWTKVLEARGDSEEAGEALADLCAAYYLPVFRFIRRERDDEDAARELTQGFFARLLERRGLDTVEPGRGRFRSFLLGAVKHFLADMRDRELAAKRGGGLVPEIIRTETDTSPGTALADPTAFAPDTFFDREWAFALLDRALKALAAEHAAPARQGQFEALKPWLTGDTENLSQASVAKRLGLNEGAVKVAIHRLRRRFRQLVRGEISQTVHQPSQVDEELRYLLEVLSNG